MTIYFTSDQHFSHFNIIKYCNRPFSTIEEMNDTIIDNYNQLITPNDTCYMMGDFAMKGSYSYLCSLMWRLNGKKHYILGNHDNQAHFQQMVNDKVIESCNQVLGVSINKQYIWMSHYPHLTWNKSHHGSWCTHGHNHSSIKPQASPFRVDVGVDAWDYKPVSFDQLVEYKKQLEDKQKALEYGVYQ
jgi:calcineurin-like phosphoesterase family protein